MINVTAHLNWIVSKIPSYLDVRPELPAVRAFPLSIHMEVSTHTFVYALQTLNVT